MKTPEALVAELYICDPVTHIFHDCRTINKQYDKRLLGIYEQRLDACNVKIRFAAKSLLAARKIVKDLEHGEFIYFDDENRLELSYYVESFLIFSRASIDLAISAYHLYFLGSSNLDSFNDFLKKLSKGIGTLPVKSKKFWNTVYEAFEADHFTWVHALVGKEEGLSLRDLVVHKGMVEVDTYIDDNDRGRFYIVLNRQNDDHVLPCLNEIFDWVQKIVDRIRRDVLDAEKMLNRTSA